MTQHDAENVRPAALAVGRNDRRPLAEVDLRLLPGIALHPSERQRMRVSEPVAEPLVFWVLGGKVFLVDYILVNPIGGKPDLQLGLDDRLERLTPARRSGWG